MRAFKSSLAAIPSAFVFFAVWMMGALSFFERSSGRRRPDLIGTNHTPNYDFVYYAGGERIQFWSLEAPVIGFALVSLALIAWCFAQRTSLGWSRVSGVIGYALIFAVLLVVASVFFYFSAVSIFI